MSGEEAIRCPCNSGNTLPDCCGKFLAANSHATAPTAQALMRSRFSAYALGNADYLLATWHPETRPLELDLDERQEWLRLDVLNTVAGGPWDDSGTVHFVAHFRFNGQRGKQEENSHFIRADRRWYYHAEVNHGEVNNAGTHNIGAKVSIKYVP